MARADYKTQQRELLLSCLRENAERHMTVENVLNELQRADHTIGQTTIYRNLDKLVEAGAVRKYVMDGTVSACYQYVPDEEVCESFHFKCETCGMLLHLHCETLERIQRHVYERHSFQINALKTVFYGICAQCLQEN